MSRRSVYYRFPASSLEVCIDRTAECDELLAVLSFFSPFQEEQPADGPDARLLIREFDPEFKSSIMATGEVCIIRRSVAADFNFDAYKLVTESSQFFVNERMTLSAPFKFHRGCTFEVGIGASFSFQLIELIRDLVLRLEEDRGTLVLHAAAIENDGHCIAIAGPKGAGKTTTMLAAIFSGTWFYVSGDKLLCRLVDGEVAVTAWRDFPYVGKGTLMLFPGLLGLLPGGASVVLAPHVRDDDKFLLDREAFEGRHCKKSFSSRARRLDGVIFPHVRAGDVPAWSRVQRRSDRWRRFLSSTERYSDSTYSDWQDYLVPDSRTRDGSLSAFQMAVEPLPMFELRGQIDAATFASDPREPMGLFSLPQE